MNEQNNAPRSPYAEAIASLYSQLQNARAGENLPLTSNIFNTTAADRYKAGEPVANGYVPSDNYGGSQIVGGNGQYGIFTNLIGDMYGNFKGVMPEDRVDNYGNQVLQTGSDPLGTKIGATQPTYEAAVAESNRIAELQNAYNNLLAMANRR